LQENFERFREKWGMERTAGYRLPEQEETEVTEREKPGRNDANGIHSPLPLLPPVQKARTSLCMIVRNGEAGLEACLASVRDLVEEIIIVDTGSTDRTKEIALEHGARVVDFAWEDSFAAARNESLRHATGEWILWLDADERLDETNRARLRTLLDSLGDENAAYVMRQSSPLEGATHATAHVDQVRLFRNLPGLRWRYRVHEQILIALRQHGAELWTTGIVITHDGFAEPGIQGPKVERNLRLLRMEIEENPDDAFVLYNLGAVLMTQNNAAEGLTYLRRSLERSQAGDNLVPKLHALITRCHHQLGERAEALAACRRGRAGHPEDAELLFWEALLLREAKDLRGAEACLLKLLQAPRTVNFTSMDSGLHGFRGRHFLAEIYREQGRLSEAEAHWREVVLECPGFGPAWRSLAEVLLARKEFAAAREILQEMIAQDAKALWPRVLLSHVLLQEGADWAAAEQALRHILDIDPNFAEAQHNLQVLAEMARKDAKTAKQSTADSGSAQVSDAAVATSAFLANLASLRAKVSLCMIVKDEEENLPACLGSVADLVDEIIVVDTGSSDGTCEIAERLGAKVLHFPWVDSFAAARNESLRHATGEWIFWMDADDRLDEANRVRIRLLFASLRDENAAYVMKCLCLPDAATKSATEVDHLRLFRNDARLRWRFRVHEQILPALRGLQAEVRWSDAVIHHTGYQDAALRGRKLERDLRLLRLEEADDPDNPFVLFNLGSIYQEQKRTAEALALFRRSLQLSDPSDSIVRKLYTLVAQCHNQLDQPQEALAACRAGKQHYPDDIELLFQEGIALRSLGDLPGARASWERVLTTPPGAHFASMNIGIRGYMTHHNLAMVNHALGLFVEAEAQWRAVLAERPDYEAAWPGLGEVYLAQKRWPELEEVAGRLEAGPNGDLESLLLRGRAKLARQDFAAARDDFKEAANRYPQEVRPRQLISHAYLQEGRNWAGAEQALRAVLALHPGHQEARQNLAVLLDRRGVLQQAG